MDSGTETSKMTNYKLSVWIVILLLIIAWFVAKQLFKILKRILSVCNELNLFWNMTSINGTVGRQLQLHTYVCPTIHLDQVSMNEVYEFYKSSFNRLGTVQNMTAIVKSYTHILLCRSRLDGSLRGAALFGVTHHQGYTTIKNGFFLFRKHFKGSGILFYTTGLLATKELLKHPFTPVFLVGKAHTYKSYLLVTKFLESYPRYDRETPPMYKKVFDDFAKEYIETSEPTAKYHPDRFVMETEGAYVKENISALTEYDLKNPHIRYFVDTNPGWKEGHCIVSAAQLSWIGLAYATIKAIGRTISQGKKSTSKPSSYSGESEASTEGPRRKATSKNVIGKRRPLKRFTFQDLTANSYIDTSTLDDEAIPFDCTPSCSSPGPVDLAINLSSLKI